MARVQAALLAIAICSSCGAELPAEDCDAPGLSLLQGNMQLISMKVSASTGDNLYGNPDCPCIGVDKLGGHVTGTMSDGKKVSYPADLGAHCEAWDAKITPGCPGKSWCEEKWCYVDPCTCKNVAVLPKPSNYLAKAEYQGRPLHFSYVTCGSKDSYSAADAKKTSKDIEKTCSVKVDSAKWGQEDCRCTGIAPKTGVAKVTMGGTLTDFPADTGGDCQAWEQDNDPACKAKGNSTPSYCSQKWCYVDPCKCKSATPPKTSSYLPNEKSQGKPVYFSYTTCGGSDSWTSGNKEACVNQKTNDDCGKLEKCAWTGKECLGKELVSVCMSDSEESGTPSSKVIVALILSLLGTFC